MSQTFLWPFATNKATITLIAAFNGLAQGMFITLYLPAVAQLDDVSPHP